MNLYDAEAIKKAQKIVKVQPKANIKLPKSPTIGKPIRKVIEKLDMSKNTKGFINPTAIVNDTQKIIKKSPVSAKVAKELE